MERIGVVGLTWRQGGEEAIARFTLDPEERARRLPEIAREIGAAELVYVATCNRVELAFVVADPDAIGGTRRAIFRAFAGHDPLPGEAERTFRAWAGEGAAEHLFLVATGLDSARLGETEISGQVRDALDEARAIGLAGRRLGPLFDEALKVSRRIHGHTEIGAGRTSLAEIALDRLRPALEQSGGRPVALFGVSPMTRRCAASLAAEFPVELLIVNRTLERARELGDEIGSAARPVALEDFQRDPSPVCALVSATASPTPLLGRDELGRLAARCGSTLPLVVDLAIPPDVDPRAAAALGFERVGMDEVIAEAEATRAQRRLELGEARALVDEALAGLRRRWSGRALDAAVVALQQHYRDQARHGLERLLKRELAGLDDAQQAVLRAWSDNMARKLAHVPMRGLREVAYEAGGGALEAFFRGADERLARELQDAFESAGTIPEEGRA